MKGIFSLLLALLAGPVASANTKVVKDLSYYEGSDAHAKKHQLDLYLPSARSEYPIVIFVHGGSWTRGDKNAHNGAYGLLARSLVEEGFGVAVINYRLSPQVKHPEHVRDVARAIAWVYKNSNRYAWSREKIFLLGHSAGAHLASLAAVDPQYLAELGLKPRILRGVIGVSGVYDLSITGVTGRFVYEPVFSSNPKTLEAASPALQVKMDPPDFLLLYAENDYFTADLQARRFADVLEEAGASVELHGIPNHNHVDIIAGAARQGNLVREELMGFLRSLSR